jgi:hypothetical protein
VVGSVVATVLVIAAVALGFYLLAPKPQAVAITKIDGLTVGIALSGAPARTLSANRTITLTARAQNESTGTEVAAARSPRDPVLRPTVGTARLEGAANSAEGPQSGWWLPEAWTEYTSTWTVPSDPQTFTVTWDLGTAHPIVVRLRY